MSNNENKDWLNEYPALKQVNSENPFSVPEGYFDSLQERIVSLKTFGELTEGIEGDCFLLPDNYFENLQANINSRLFIENFSKSDASGFTIPENYFEELEERINGQIFAEENLPKYSNEFTVPEGYFGNLTQEILSKTVENKQAPRKNVIRVMFASTAFKYATAACFAVAIGGGFLINRLTNPVYVHNHSYLHKELSAVPIEDIKSYLEIGVDAGETQHTLMANGQTVDDKKLNDALQDYADSVQ